MSLGIKQKYPQVLQDAARRLHTSFTRHFKGSGRRYEELSPLVRAAWCEVALEAVRIQQMSTGVQGGQAPVSST